MAIATTGSQSHPAVISHIPIEELETGMPQLDVSTFPNQIFWLVVTLIVIHLILSRVALPRIGLVLADRQNRIIGDIAMAEELKQKAVDAEAAYEKALADARAKAQEIAAETRAEMQEVVAGEMEKAEAEIAAKAAESEGHIAEIRSSALESVTVVARDIAQELVGAVSPVRVDDRTITAAVTSRMKK